MIKKTDNPAEVGMHVFEKAGLGKAPFRVTGFSESIFKATPDSPARPGTSCDYCGTGIMTVCHIRGADGKEFKVGCNCVEKTGDAGLIRAYKTLPEYRAMLRKKTEMKIESVKEEMRTIMTDPAVLAIFDVEIVGKWNGQDETRTMYLRRMWDYCGAAGRARYLKFAKALIKKAQATPE